jgi:hypothetical protein
MTKHYCDGCGIEMTKSSNKRSVGVPCHLYSRKGQIGYVDGEHNAVSGRMDQLDLCAKCINTAYTAFLKVLDLPNE